MLAEIQKALGEREQQGTQALIDLHGGLDGWFAACRATRAADPDLRLARVITRLLHRGGSGGGSLSLTKGERRCMVGEEALIAFWESVATSGAAGWREERARVREVEQAAAASAEPNERLLMLDVWAVRSLMETYRTWGQMLIDCEHPTG
jgi:hypothetical protein